MINALLYVLIQIVLSKRKVQICFLWIISCYQEDKTIQALYHSHQVIHKENAIYNKKY